MCRKSTIGFLCAAWICGLAVAQTAPAPLRASWRKIGNFVIDKGLAGEAGGPAARLWYSLDGATLFALTAAGDTFQSTDFDHWAPASVQAPPLGKEGTPRSLPEPEAQWRYAPSDPLTVYAFGKYVYRSLDNGRSWENLTLARGISIVGEHLHDLAVAPGDPDEVAVAGDDGIFRSADGGRSWSSLNAGLANLGVTRILDLPEGSRGVRIAVGSSGIAPDGMGGEEAVTWPPGTRAAWVPASSIDLAREREQRQALEEMFGVPVTSLAKAGDFTYSGLENGEIYVWSGQGSAWNIFTPSNAGKVDRIWVDDTNPRVAVAAVRGAGAPNRSPLSTAHVRVFQTADGGTSWDDITADLPSVTVHGIAADRGTGAVYLATDAGVFMSFPGLAGLAQIQPWTLLDGLPPAPAMDVRLDAGGNHLWAAVRGYGVYVTMAPHRRRDPRVVDAADWATRALAPGTLLTLLGANAESVRLGDATATVLAATPDDTQIQVPFDIQGRVLPLTVTVNGAVRALPALPVIPAAPAIFVDQDGSPMLLDADTGLPADASHPARPGSRIQILATGLGRVSPEWPAGLPAPSASPPAVAGTVRGYLDRNRVEVMQATLAPGYAGMYLVEILIPQIVNAGAAELFIEVDGAPSNRVRVYIEP
jgi:uncharacterized protein (TIGR03437 family)